MPGKFERHGVKVPPTETEREAAEVAADVLRTGAERVARTFTEPDDDWRPMYIIVTKRQGTIVTPVLGREGYAPAKHDFAKYVGELARRFGAQAIGQLESTWAIRADRMPEPAFEAAHAMMGRGETIEHVEGRTEQLMLNTYTASTWAMRWAPIERHDDAPPTLGPWERMSSSDDDAARVEGAMFTPLQRAVWRRG